MFKSLLIPLFCIFAASTTVGGSYERYAVTANSTFVAPTPDSISSGRYTGGWTATPAGLGFFEDGESEHEGTWDIVIAPDGDVTGTEVDKTSGNKAHIAGFIDSDGQINVSVKYSTTSTIKGFLEQRGIRLIGTLKQYCGGRVCSRIELTLKRQ
jgi:hypothetical protein